MSFTQQKNNTFYEVKIKSFISKLASALNASDKEMCRYLNYTSYEYQQFQRGEIFLDMARLEDLGEKFKFSFDSLKFETIDFEVLKNHQEGSQQALSAKYTKGASSRKINILNVFRYIEKTRGAFAWFLIQDILNYFQLSKEVLADPQGFINITFYNDLFKYLRFKGLGSRDIEKIGSHSISTAKETSFSKKLSLASSPSELFQLYFEELITLVEKNNKYKIISLTNNQCTVRAFEIPDVLDTFKVRHVGGLDRCLYRKGALAETTTLIGLPSAKVDETSCVHRGDSVCTYVINFENSCAISNAYSH